MKRVQKKIQTQVEEENKIKTKIYAGAPPSKAVKLTSRVTSRVSTESQRLDNEYHKKLSDYQIRKDFELEQYKTKIESTIIETPNSSDFLNTYRNDLKNHFSERKVVFIIIIRYS